MSMARDPDRVTRTVGLLAAVVLLAVEAATAATSGAAQSSAFPGQIRNGKIAFSEIAQDGGRFGRFPSDLYLIDPDGTNRRRLSECTIRDCFVRAFAWSPGGRRLAFVRGSAGGVLTRLNLSLYVIGADGGHFRRLNGCGKPRWPSCGDFNGSQISWSPDGSRIVVPRERSLYLFNVNRNQFRRLTSCGSETCFDMHPAWSPDGRHILFVRVKEPYAEALYSIKPDGTGQKRLTKLHGAVRNPTWSLDGRRIVFVTTDGLDDRLFVVGANGSGLKMLRSGPSGTGPAVPAWSADGSRLVFLTTPGLPGGYRLAIWVIGADGKGRRLLYRSACCIETWGRPSWSPDGRYVSFGVDLQSDAARSGVFVIRANGTNLRRLAAAATEAAWQPMP
jgi:Tol biopolymer transport system component